MDSVRNKVLDKMKRTLRRERHLSTSGSVTSISSICSSKTRPRSEGEDQELNTAAKVSQNSTLMGSASQSRLPGPLKSK